jgi:hypothetical protein
MSPPAANNQSREVQPVGVGEVFTEAAGAEVGHGDVRAGE